MKAKFAILTIALTLGLLSTGTATAATVAEIEADIAQFQGYFLDRFPDLAKQNYNQGNSALPQYARRMEIQALMLELSPWQSDLEAARSEWDKPFENGASLESCFAFRPPANEFPYYNGEHVIEGPDGKQVVTIAGAINQCLTDNAQPALELDSVRLAGLITVFREKSNGQAQRIDYSDPAMREIYARGREFFWAMRGQNNFSCASCHVHNSGNSLRGEIVSAALGHGTGFPLYYLQRDHSSSGQGSSQGPENLHWGTLHRRYATCNIIAGAAPFAPQSPQYIALEVYQSIMNTGIPLNVPGFRQ